MKLITTEIIAANVIIDIMFGYSHFIISLQIQLAKQAYGKHLFSSKNNR